MIENKNFVINLNQKLRDSFPVGNLYANKVNYFKNLETIDKSSRLNQLVITNENLNEVKSLLQNNPNMFLVYVSNDIPAGKEGNSMVIKQTEIPKFIIDLEGIQRVGKDYEGAAVE